MESSTWYVIKQRLAWIKMHERGAPVTGVCQHYGISRKTFYKWWHRYQEGDRDFHALRDRSRRPHAHPRSVPRATVERVLTLRPHSALGWLTPSRSYSPSPPTKCYPCLTTIQIL